MKIDVATVVTDRIIEAMEAGTIPWRKPWRPGSAVPRNAITGHAYRGINYWLTSMLGHDDPRFLTFKQAQANKGTVIKGSRSMPVVFWSRVEKEDADGNVKPIMILKYYNVFHISQVEGIDWDKLKSAPPIHEDHDPLVEAEGLIAGMPNAPTIRTVEGDKAYYTPATDVITVPAPHQYDKVEEYYSTLFHELTHSTGHDSRLKRDIKNGFASELYSKEELVAEFGAAYLCSLAGIDNTVENSAAYLKHWLTVLKGDRKMIINAAAQAQKAVDYITGTTFNTEA